MKNKSIKLLFYCTKAKPYLYMPYEFDAFNYDEASQCYLSKNKPILDCDVKLNGKIVAEAECELVEKEEYSYLCDEYATFDDDRLENACLSRKQINEYGKYKPLYLIHLKNVKPFYEPKELSYYGLKKAPQNMCCLYDENGNIIAVVISIKSPHMCNIMNGFKTIEVRTHIVNALKELNKS